MQAKVSKTCLHNGIRILTKQIPHVHSVSMGVWVDAGARDETPAENGLSHLIEHMIFKGTKRRTAFQIAKEFDAIGGQSNAFTSMENTCFHGRVMDTHLATMVDIFCDIFLNSTFDDAELERERPIILQEIGMVEDSPEEFIHVLLGKAYWGNHPLGQSVLGTRENLLLFDSAMIKDFFRRFYQPGRIVISAAGNLNHDQFLDLAAPAFEAVAPGPDLPCRLPPNGQKQQHISVRDLEQVHIGLATRGLSVSDPRRYACSLMNTILGGNMSSRLFQEIRELRGLAYSVYSFISPQVGGGMFGAYAGVEPGRVGETVDLILQEMRKLKISPVTTDELRDAKEYTKGQILLSAESVENQMARLAQNEMHMGRYVPVEEIVGEIEAVTQEDISSLACELFHTDPLSLALLGPVAAEFDFNPLLVL
ncbi:MAG: pitrilysin family protein [Desulfobacterales bacterium]|jgi:predicted Zn-dependent peptidase|nr:pitrilysin family protein [Desulfobacterales bacterium]